MIVRLLARTWSEVRQRFVGQLITGAALLLTSCARMQMPSTTTCLAADRGIAPVRLGDGTRVFVEPQGIAAAGGKVLVAGTPNYLWRTSESGGATLVGRDTVLGVVIDGHGTGALVPAPIVASRVHNVRTASYENGTWAVVFAEAPPPERPRDDPRVVAYWFGVTDGSRWLKLERLPSVAGEPLSYFTSNLVRTSTGVAIAIPLRRAGGDVVVVFSENAGRWATSEVRPGVVSYVTLAVDSTSVVLGIVHPDLRLQRDGNSLWLYRRELNDSMWRSPTLLMRGAAEPVDHPHFTDVGGEIAAAWQAKGPTGRVPQAAMLTKDGVMRKRFTLAPSSEQSLPPLLVLGQPLWVTPDQQRGPGQTPSLMLSSFAGDTALQLVSIRNPFQGVIGTAALGASVIIVGPIQGVSPQDPVVSLSLQKIVVRCG